MNARHVSRELALLSLPQIWAAEGEVDHRNLVEQAVRFLITEAQDSLRRAAEMFNKGQDMILESSLRDDVEASRNLLSQAYSEGERALNLVDQAIDWPVMSNLAAQEDVRKYATHLTKLVQTHKDEIDELLNREMTGWTVDRLHSLDRDVLRLSVAELMYEGGLPIEVGLDEAVELAKRFGSNESSGFVNGVLKRVLPAIEAVRKGERLSRGEDTRLGLMGDLKQDAQEPKEGERGAD